MDIPTAWNAAENKVLCPAFCERKRAGCRTVSRGFMVFTSLLSKASKARAVQALSAETPAPPKAETPEQCAL
jgi:hypothetical protein